MAVLRMPRSTLRDYVRGRRKRTPGVLIFPVGQEEVKAAASRYPELPGRRSGS
jgi:hypothetical protein